MLLCKNNTKHINIKIITLQALMKKNMATQNQWEQNSTFIPLNWYMYF